MKKILAVISFIMIISMLLIGCSEKTGGEVNSDNEEVKVDEEETIEDEEGEEEVNEDELNESEREEELEEETFADEIKVLDVEKMVHDQEEVSEFNANEDTIIEHDERLYIEHDFITEILDMELTYDEENTFAEIFEEKGDFHYEANHEDGAMMDIGQIYVEELDDYENISGEEEELYKFIEYEGKLYVPERLINVYMKEPLNYERRDETLEIGLKSESTTVYDLGITDGSSSAEVTQNASDVTIEGENYEGGVVLRDVNSASKEAHFDIDYNYSLMEGFVHNHSDDETVEVRFQYDDDKTLDSVKLSPGDTHEFDYKTNGEGALKVLAKGEPGSSSEVVIVGELK